MELHLLLLGHSDHSKPYRIVCEFLLTANLMKKIKIRHQNTLQLHAVCPKEEPVYIVTEFMKHGSLLEYLRGEGRSLKLPQLIS